MSFDAPASARVGPGLATPLLLNITGSILGWIKDLLSNRTQKVLMNGESSDLM